MNIWTLNQWKKSKMSNFPKSGLFFRFEKDVHADVRQDLIEFSKWLRTQYEFPSKVTVYVKSTELVRAKDGDLCCGTCFQPFNKEQCVHIKLATGDYETLRKEWGKDEALNSILLSAATMLTHYFQWLNDMGELDEAMAIQQAEENAMVIVQQYLDG